MAPPRMLQYQEKMITKIEMFPRNRSEISMHHRHIYIYEHLKTDTYAQLYEDGATNHLI